jgi:hypothetical protein
MVTTPVKTEPEARQREANSARSPDLALETSTADTKIEIQLVNVVVQFVNVATQVINVASKYVSVVTKIVNVASEYVSGESHEHT